MFPNIEFSKHSKDDVSFVKEADVGPDDGVPFWIPFKRICNGEVHISPGNMLQLVVVTGPLLIELLTNVGSKGDDADKVPWRSGDLIDLAFINSAASALDIFSCFFHLVRRF